MAVDHIRYDLLTQDALRGVIRTVLTDVAARGLPGEHHFFITFDTRIDGVRMSARLKASYPEDMTIVLQHQFWDLTVGDDDFAVGLAFNGIPERLHIPFKAVKAFLDPSVQFGLQFVVDGEADAGTPAHAATGKPAPVDRGEPAKLAPSAKPPRQPDEEPTRQAASPAKPAAAPAAGREDSSAEVVRLDRFRKK
jgi:uncharacterized protein